MDTLLEAIGIVLKGPILGLVPNESLLETVLATKKYGTRPPMTQSKIKFSLPLRACALTLLPIGFALRSVQTHISMRNCFEKCVCTLLKANPMGGRVRAYALKGKSKVIKR